MASGAPVVQIVRLLPPGTLYATEDVRVGGSTPAETLVVYDFDATTVEYMDFLAYLTGYGGGGLTFVLMWAATTATSGSVRWEMAIRRLQDDAEDIDTAQTYDYNSVTDPCASASGELSYPTITFTNGADMDNWADGELAIIRLRRKADDAGDDMTGDAELVAFSGKET